MLPAMPPRSAPGDSPGSRVRERNARSAAAERPDRRVWRCGAGRTSMNRGDEASILSGSHGVLLASIFIRGESMKIKLAGCIALLLAAVAANADDVVRYPLANGNKFPIARAVEVPAGTTLIFHSGMTPSPADPKATAGTAAYWGDTKTQ